MEERGKIRRSRRTSRTSILHDVAAVLLASASSAPDVDAFLEPHSLSVGIASLIAPTLPGWNETLYSYVRLYRTIQSSYCHPKELLF
jgi:hypothetical protein